jgi:hypothetical protein
MIDNCRSHGYKGDVPKLNTTIFQAPIFEWYVVMCRSKKWYQKGMHIKEIGLRALNMLTFLDSKVNVI